MPFTHALSTNNYGTSRIIVDPNPANGTHTSISAAIASASAGDVIIIKPATYVEAYTVDKNLTFFSYDSSFRDGERVTISGKCTLTADSVNIGFYGIKFDTNADNSFLLTGNSSSIVCDNCYFNADVANTLSMTGNSSTAFYAINSAGNFANTFSLGTTTNGAIWLQNCTFVDATTPGTMTSSAGSIRVINSMVVFPVSVTSTGVLIIVNSNFGGEQSPQVNTTWVTTAGSGTSFIDNSTFNSGTASAISIGTGTTVVASGLRVSSSNTNAISGLGTIQYGSIDFSGSSSTINTSTQTALTTQLGTLNLKTPLTIANGGTQASSMSTSTGIVKYDGTSLVTSTTAKIDSSNRMTNTSQPCFLVQVQTPISNVTGDGTVYSVLFDTTTYDQGSNITLNSSGKTIFTAPVTGKYLLQASITLTTATVAQQTQIRIITTGRTYFAGFNLTNAGNSMGLPITCICDMTAADTALIQVFQGGVTKNASVSGSGSATVGLVSWFSGNLVC
jgi:hypothetical protein